MLPCRNPCLWVHRFDKDGLFPEPVGFVPMAEAFKQMQFYLMVVQHGPVSSLLYGLLVKGLTGLYAVGCLLASNVLRNADCASRVHMYETGI